MLEFSDEWKAYFPITSVFNPPLLLANNNNDVDTLGPLFFSPSPKTLTPLFSSPSLSPPLSPSPFLSLHRFLQTSTSSLSSTSSSLLPLPLANDAASYLNFNRLASLHCNDKKATVLFFPTGENLDKIGFLILRVKDGNLRAFGGEKDEVLSCGDRVYHRIIRVLVSNVVEGFNNVDGYLLVFCMYSVHWYRVEWKKDREFPVLRYSGCKVFKSCGVVGACWSPHLREECLVLLESGELFLFDVSVRGCKGKRFRVPWEGVNRGLGEEGEWLGCEFGWHPRVFVVACSDAVYLVDFRFGQCDLTCFAKVGMSSAYAKDEKDQFLAFCKVGDADADGHHRFAVASGNLLILCDARKPLVPLLQWGHNIRSPCYIDVFRLSDLRARSREDRFSAASALGFGIVLGSFWNCEFTLFCYGPSPVRRVGSELPKMGKSLYAWGLPSDLLLTGRACGCGSCTVREEFWKDSLPGWIDWQAKKEVVLGFGILSKDLSGLLSEPDEYGGFTLIRLMSSGKLESQRYSASWEFVKKLEEAHRDAPMLHDNNFLYDFGDEEYRFAKRFKYYKFDYLYSYLNGKLAQFMETSMRRTVQCPRESEAFALEYHEILCEKLKACGFGRFRSSPAVSVVFNNVSLPTSIHEVALRKMWAGLPVDLLQLAFSTYSECLEVFLDKKKVSLEFPSVPDLCQLPPFFLNKPSPHSNKWKKDVPSTENTLVGPVLPLPILLTLHEYRNGCPNSEETDGFSVEKEYSSCSDEVLQVAREMAVSVSGPEHNSENAVSLADDGEDLQDDSQKVKNFILYHPNAPKMQHDTQDKACYEEEKFGNLIYKKPQKESVPCSATESVGLELFDDLCPINLKFGASAMSFTPKQLKTYKMLKRQFSKWQEEFLPYKDFCEQTNLRKKD